MESFHAVIYVFFLSSVCTSAYGVVRCPIISNLGDVIAIGNTEKATNGDVIHFECESPKILSGPEDIHCKDNGQWSGPIPKCIGVICLPPEIPHGFSDPNKVYKENNILQYRCDPGYTPRHGNSWCTTLGWSIKPECEEMICLLGALTPGISSTNPKGKNIFQVGEEVEITCSNSPWLFERTHESRKIKCQVNGNWEVSPGCEEPICEYPRGERLLYPTEPNYRMLYTFKERIQYRCELGFKGTAANITCTENDWEPKPLCTVVRCPTISNLGDVIATGNTEEASYGDVIHFECASPKILDGPENINCTENGQWSGTVPKCKKTTCLLGAVTPGIVSINPRGKNIFQVGEHVEITCSKSHWLLGTKHESRRIKCQEGGEWESRPVCEEIECLPPVILNGFTDHNRVYRDNDMIKYTCNPGYKQRAGNSRCTKYGWSIPPECEEITCLLGARTPGIASTSPPGKNIFRVGEYVTITCEKNYWNFWTKQVSQQIKCQDNGKFESSAVCDEMTCGYPRGQHLSYPFEYYYSEARYKLMKSIEYRCERGYKKTATRATCTENGWDPELLCTEIICELEDIHGVSVFGVPQNNTPIKFGHKLYFHCSQSGMVLTGSPEVTCSAEGKWSSSFPICKVHKGCGPPPYVEFADIATFQKSFYNSGEKVEYRCQQLYTIDGDNFKTCVQGIWTGSVRCLKPCTVTIEDMDAHKITQFYGTKRLLYATHQHHVTFKCQYGRFHVRNSAAFRQQCIDGVMHLPTCQ